MLSDTIAHEIGHYLGMGHSSDKSHLMYGTERPIPDVNFDEKGYTVPKKLESTTTWIVSESLHAKYNQLKSEHEQLNSEYETLENQLRRYPRTISDPLQYQQAMSLTHKANTIVNQMNSIIDQMNSIANQLNCLGNINGKSR